MDKEYRLDITVKNNLILKRIEGLGYPNLKRFCEAYEISYNMAIELVALRDKAVNSRGHWRPIVIKLSDIFNCMPEELFSQSQINCELKSNKRRVEIAEEEAKFLLTNPSYLLQEHKAESFYLEEQSKEALDKALSALTPRERNIIEGRFFDEKTLKKIGIEEDVSGHRIRQIESAALRKLRWIFKKDEALRDKVLKEGGGI